MVVDLIYVFGKDEQSLSCALIDGADRAKDRLLGPVPSKGGVKQLAPLVREAVPEMFPTLKDAEALLTTIHFRNMMARENSFGQIYPFDPSPKADPSAS